MRRLRSGPLQTELLGFASDGVYPAPGVAIRAVSSYLAFSPLPSTYHAITSCDDRCQHQSSLVRSSSQYSVAALMRSLVTLDHLSLRPPVLWRTPRFRLPPSGFDLIWHNRCWAVCFLWHFPPAPAVRVFQLGSILPCEARTFLSHGATIRLPHSGL